MANLDLVALVVKEYDPAIDFFVPSRDGKLVAVSLSEGGSEEGTLHIYEVATGKKLPDTIVRVSYPTAGGDLVWDETNAGFFYTRYPRGAGGVAPLPASRLVTSSGMVMTQPLRSSALLLTTTSPPSAAGRGTATY